MVKGNGKIRIAATALAVVFSWYWCSITFFAHIHEIDGVRIVHSHPYTGCPTASHTHSAGQMQTISYLSFFIALAALFSAAPDFTIGRSFVFVPMRTCGKNAEECRAFSLRAPPSFGTIA